MSKIKIKRPHGKTQEAALNLGRKLGNKLAKTYDLENTWSNDGVEFSRNGVKGSMLIDDHSIAITLDLSMPVSLFKSKIESEINKELDKIL